MKHVLASIKQKAKTFLKRGLNLSAAVIMLTGVVAAAIPATATAKNLTPTPRVSFTFDDGLSSALAEAAPVLAAYGFTGTDYITTDCIGTVGTCAADPTANYMTWEQVAQLEAMGWEIAAHTQTHPQLATDLAQQGKLSQVISELTNSKQALADHGYNAANFAFPYGDYNNDVLAEVAKLYSSARGFWDIGYNTWPYTDSLIVNQQVQVGDGGATVDQVKAMVDTAVANNQWLILTFHDIKDTPTQGADSYDYATADLDAIAAYVKQKGVAVTNINDGLVSGETNLLPNGTFNSGIAEGWTTDDPTNIKADSGNNGRYPDPTNSVSLASHTGANSGSRDGKSHLYSPMVSVDPTDKYVIKGYLNVKTITANEVAFFVDEYDANGNWLSGQLKQGIAYNADANAIRVSDVNFEYVPSSASVARASLQLIVPNDSGVTGYFDGAQWYSVNGTTQPGDTTPPAISNITVTGVTSSSATISWTTDEPTTGVVHYGETKNYDTTTTATALGTSHSVTLTGLKANTTYLYQVHVTDVAGNENGTTSGENFKTQPAGKLGDLNNDGVVNLNDLSILSSNWGRTGATAAQGDLNSDGIVNLNDLSILSSNWSK